MSDLYTWATPNGRKVSIVLEEIFVPYKAHAVDITKDEQFEPEFLKISPNNRIPAIFDHDNGMETMESGDNFLICGQRIKKVANGISLHRGLALPFLPRTRLGGGRRPRVCAGAGSARARVNVAAWFPPGSAGAPENAITGRVIQ